MIACLLWIESAWPEGTVAAQFAAIGCSLFATFDKPSKVISAAVIGVVVALPFGAVYEFAIIPRIDGFASLAVVLTPALLLFSLMQTGDFPELRKEARRARDILFRAAQEAAHSEETDEQAGRPTADVVSGRVLAHVAWAAIHGAVMLETSEMLQMGVDVGQLVDGIALALSHLSGGPSVA